MKFRFEKEGYIPSGAMAYSVPSREECEKAYEQLRTICLEELEKRFPGDKDTCDRVLFELDCYRLNKQVMELLILREIAAFSHENGYPVMMPGMENKLVLFELLGITDVRPTEMDYCLNFGEMAFANFPEAEPMFEIHVAAQIRDKLPDRLNTAFGSIDSIDGREKHINIQPFETLDCIGELAARTGVPYKTINLADLYVIGDPELLNALANDIIRAEFGWKPDAVPCHFLTDVARLYAFAHCNVSGERTPELYRKVKDYVFRDDIYGQLTQHGVPAPIALHLARNWAKGIEKERNVEMMRRRGTLPELLDAYGLLQNQWPESSCIAHVTVLAILKYYELHFPKQYAAVLAQFNAQEEEIL